MQGLLTVLFQPHASVAFSRWCACDVCKCHIHNRNNNMASAKLTPAIKGNDVVVVSPDGMLSARVQPGDVCINSDCRKRAKAKHRPVMLCDRWAACNDNGCTAAHPTSSAAFRRWVFTASHINHVFQRIEHAPYPRCATPGAVTVLKPNKYVLDDGTIDPGTILFNDVPLSRLLATRGTIGLADGGHVAHCAHFYFGQACNRGADCLFAHVVSIDPSTTGVRFASKKVIRTAPPTPQQPPPPPPPPTPLPHPTTHKLHVLRVELPATAEIYPQPAPEASVVPEAKPLPRPVGADLWYAHMPYSPTHELRYTSRHGAL
jgi:hypothetical protein